MSKLRIIEGVVQDYTIVLSTRDYKHLGQIIKLKNVNHNENLNSASEFSFTVNKYELVNDYKSMNIPYETHKKIVENLWEQIIDLKLIWVKEIDAYFEIKVSVNDSAETFKTITATSLCEVELSQTYIYNMEINNESDITREDYDVNFPTVLYRNPENVSKYDSIWLTDDKYNDYVIDDDGNKVLDEEATYTKRYNILKSSSLMHRALDKMVHYSIAHVDESLCNLQRTFSVDGSTVYDFFTGECSEQFNCLFKFDSTNRSISVYDLYTTCNDCGYRDDYYDECPKCKSKNLKYFGKDTTILVDKNNLTDDIHLEVNADSIKNCFKLSAGDELMTAAIRTLNPNGSDYLYNVSEFQRQDMPKELVDILDDYSLLYESYTDTYEKLVEQSWDISAQIDVLEHSKMPTIENAEVTAQTEVNKLTSENLSPLGLSSITKATSTATVSSALKNYAKAFVKSGYVKIEIADGANFVVTLNNDGSLYEDSNAVHYGKWTGEIIITNYSDEEDVARTGIITIDVYDNYQEFISQKILKSLAEQHTEEGSVFDVLALEDLNEFKEALTLYNRTCLQSFRDAIDGALTILMQLNQGSEDSEFYNELYVPYYEKLVACDEAINSISEEILLLEDELQVCNNDISDIQKKLNFPNYLGAYYPIFCAYRREQTYENSNYISDGLTDAEIIERAKEFLDVAKKELIKASEPQYTLTATLKNLLVLEEFKPIVDYFEIGNWIRVKVDGAIYRLRLLGYGINFEDTQNINVEFSNVTKIKDVVYETQQILKASQSMATTFGYVSKQAEKGNKAQNSINSMLDTGLNSSYIFITNNDKEEVTYGKTGILCRVYDDITDSYDSKQLRITHNNISFTDDAWKTVKQAIGEHSYEFYNPETNQMETYTGYGMTAEFLTSLYISGKIIIGGKIYSTNYSDGKNDREAAGTFIDLDNGTFSFAGGGLRYDDGKLIISSESVGESLQNVDVTAENLHINAQNIDGYVKLNQIQGTINSKIQAEQINTVNFDQIAGTITVDAENINGQIQPEQIASIPSDKITGSIQASNIQGTLSSSQIASTLSNKNITGSFTGSVEASTIKVSENNTSYTGITGEYTITGSATLKFINGICVGFTTVTT